MIELLAIKVALAGFVLFAVLNLASTSSCLTVPDISLPPKSRKSGVVMSPHF